MPTPEIAASYAANKLQAIHHGTAGCNAFAESASPMYPGVPTLDAIRLLASICLEYLHAETSIL